jgi:hypothetical protein
MKFLHISRIKALFSLLLQKPKTFQDFLLHQMLRYMHALPVHREINLVSLREEVFL